MHIKRGAEEFMDYKTVYKGGCGEIVEKKSRFLAEVFPVESEAEAAEALEQVKKKYWDARHHCWAYTIGEAQVQERFSDDGEPGGTAGKPILEVLRGNALHNTLIIVTRYFGGTLLGTGGLVRAYTQSAQAGIAASVVITRINGCKLKLITDYSALGKLQYLLAARKIPVLETVYVENVILVILVSAAEEAVLVTDLNEATGGQTEVIREGPCRFAVLDGNPVLF